MICTQSLVFLYFFIHFLLFVLLGLDDQLLIQSLLSFEEGIVQLYVYLCQLKCILHPIRNSLLLAVDTVEEGLHELGQGFSLDGFSESAHECEQEVDVVHRQKVTEIVVLFDHVQIGSCKIGAGFTSAPFLQRAEVSGKDFVPQFDFSEGGEGSAKPGSSGGEDAVKHVNSQCHSQG